MGNKILLSDHLSLKDEAVQFPAVSSGLWARTEVIGSYGNFVHGKGKTTFDMPELFHQHNIVPVGGVSYVMQRLFEVPETQITIPTMKEPLAADYTGGEGNIIIHLQMILNLSIHLMVLEKLSTNLVTMFVYLV